MKSGAQAEKIAALFLQRKGLTLVESNYRCRFGEIDLVLRDRGTLVFAEVRLRRSQRFGGPASSIDRRKQMRIITAARHYLAARGDSPCRFDVVLLERLNSPHIEWIRDAFSA